MPGAQRIFSRNDCLDRATCKRLTRCPIFNDLRYLFSGRCPIFNDLRYLFSGLFELRIDLGLSSAILIRPNPRPSLLRPNHSEADNTRPSDVICKRLTRCPIFNDLRYLFSGLFELRIDLGLSSATLIRPNPPAGRETIRSRRCLASTSTEERKVPAPKVNGEQGKMLAEQTFSDHRIYLARQAVDVGIGRMLSPLSTPTCGFPTRDTYIRPFSECRVTRPEWPARLQ
jgi:hypothetical protein